MDDTQTRVYTDERGMVALELHKNLHPIHTCVEGGPEPVETFVMKPDVAMRIGSDLVQCAMELTFAEKEARRNEEEETQEKEEDTGHS